jgi:hypothetical protein
MKFIAEIKKELQFPWKIARYADIYAISKDKLVIYSINKNSNR